MDVHAKVSTLRGIGTSTFCSQPSSWGRCTRRIRVVWYDHLLSFIIERFRIRCNPRGTCHAGYHTSSSVLRWGVVKAMIRRVSSVDPLQCMNGYTLGLHITHEPTFCCTQHLIACPLTAKISSPIRQASSRTSCSNNLQDLSYESQSRPSRVVWIDDEVISGQDGLPLQCIIVVWATWGGYFFVKIKWWRILLSFGLCHEL